MRNQLDSSIKIWNTLEEHFSAINATSCFLGYDEFLSIKKEDDELLGALVARVEDVLQKLRAVRPDDLDINTFESQLAAMVLICALPEEFANFKSSLDRKSVV